MVPCNAQPGRHGLYPNSGNDLIGCYDFLGLCRLGSIKSSSIGCEPVVLHYATDPTAEATKNSIIADLWWVELGEFAAEGAAIAVGAAAAGTAQVTDALANWIATESLTFDAASVARLAKAAFDQAHGTIGGYYLWTRIHYERCTCYLHFFKKWTDEEPTPWQRYNKRTQWAFASGFDFRYEDRIRGFAASRLACDEHEQSFRSEHSADIVDA